MSVELLASWSRGLPATLQIPTSFFFPFSGGDSRHFGPMFLLFLNLCRECIAASVVFCSFEVLCTKHPYIPGTKVALFLNLCGEW